jgi:hypothetical protein
MKTINKKQIITPANGPMAIMALNLLLRRHNTTGRHHRPYPHGNDGTGHKIGDATPEFCPMFALRHICIDSSGLAKLNTPMRPWIMAALACLAPIRVSASIAVTAQMSEVTAKIAEIAQTVPPQDIWVVYDIDMTLTKPENPAVELVNLQRHHQVLGEIFADTTHEQRELAKYLAVGLHPCKTGEKDTAKCIKELQKLGIASFALTAAKSGAITLRDSPQPIYEIRPRELNALGIHFEKAFPFVTLFLKKFPANGGSFPTYHRGVICANEKPKGAVLCAFMDEIKTMPKVIAMVDDRRHNLLEMRKALRAHYPQIHFIAFEYTGATASQESVKIISADEFRAFWEPIAAQAKKNCQATRSLGGGIHAH